jgi:hypothetical protein
MLPEDTERYLNSKIDATTTVREAGGTQFIAYLLRKVSGWKTFDPTVVEINQLAMSYPGRVLTDEFKCKWMEKLEKLGVVLGP